jgi:hypothetical protein
LKVSIVLARFALTVMVQRYTSFPISRWCGGLDIYSSDLVGGKWSKPINLGKNINKNKDEMYPASLK